MNRIVLSLAFLIGGVVSASAACTSPAVMHDFPGTSFNMSLATAPDTNCQSNVALPTWAGGTLGAMANYGTSPGAVLVPGVNAFITNSPSITAAANAFAAGSLAIGAGVDGWNITEGVTTDAASTAGGTGTHSAKLRLMTTQLNSLALNQSSQITQETTTATNTGTTNTNLGAQADAAAAADNSTASLIALLKRTNQNLTTVNTTAAAPTPACAAAPCVTTVGNVGSDPSSGKGTPSSVAINVSTATTTQLVAISASTKIYVTSFDVIAGGTGNITFEYGTGSTCGTGTTVLTGAYNLTAQAGIAKGNGLGAILVVPAGNALCVLTSAAVQMSGSVSFQQF